MSDEWNTYRTRFLVRAKQLTEPLAFTDALGRDHCGVPGDYLVESSAGLLRIAPREIFEDIYVPMDHFQSDCEGTGVLTRDREGHPSSASLAESAHTQPRRNRADENLCCRFTTV